MSIETTRDDQEDAGEVAALRESIAALDAKVSALLEIIADQRTRKEWYTTDEAAKLLGRARFTVREWARLGRINAAKRRCGRGPTQDWAISGEELERVRNHGLLPLIPRAGE